MAFTDGYVKSYRLEFSSLIMLCNANAPIVDRELNLTKGVGVYTLPVLAPRVSNCWEGAKPQIFILFWWSFDNRVNLPPNNKQNPLPSIKNKPKNPKNK